MEEAVIFFLAVCGNVSSEVGYRGRRTHVVAVGEMSAIRETKTHKAVLGLDESGQSSEATTTMSLSLNDIG